MFYSKNLVLYIVLITIWLYLTENVVSIRTPFYRQCETPVLKNGQVRLRQRGKLIRYNCAPTFTLYGDRYSACQMGRWEHPVPICIKQGCASLPTVENGLIALLNSDASALLFCNSGYVVAGSALSFCDGKQWDRAIGSCRETAVGAETWCDFETSSICGWTADPNNDFEWKRRSGYATTRQLRTGPKHDHTVMIPLEGHYMVADVTDILSNDATRLLSPIYSIDLSKDACFRFYYHMFGLSVGRLRIYIKPVSMDMELIIDEPKYILYQIQGSQKNQWIESLFVVEEQIEDFQIVIEATAGRTRISDIAIDDVALLKGNECMNEQFQATTETVTEEDGGIYNIQTCANRCNETTQSTADDEIITIRPNGKTAIIEKCDCHSGCEDIKTCCFDYRTICAFADEITTETNIYTEIRLSTYYIRNAEDTTDASRNIPERTARTNVSLTSSSTIITSTTTIKPIKKYSINNINSVNGTQLVNTTPMQQIVKKSTKQILIKPFTSKPIITPSYATNKIYFLKPSSTIKPTASPPLIVSQKSALSFSQILIITLLIGGVLIICSIFIWKTCLPMCWFKYRNNPLDYKTKYYCKKSPKSVNKEDEEEIMPINGHALADTAKTKYQSQAADEYSDVRFLTTDDEHIDFTLQEG